VSDVLAVRIGIVWFGMFGSWGVATEGLFATSGSLVLCLCIHYYWRSINLFQELFG
jgi:hypothetical protein